MVKTKQRKKLLHISIKDIFTNQSCVNHWWVKPLKMYTDTVPEQTSILFFITLLVLCAVNVQELVVSKQFSVLKRTFEHFLGVTFACPGTLFAHFCNKTIIKLCALTNEKQKECVLRTIRSVDNAYRSFMRHNCEISYCCEGEISFGTNFSWRSIKYSSIYLPGP